MSSGDKKETKLTMSVLHYNSVAETVGSGTLRTSTLGPQITLSVESEFTGQYSRNWLYVSAESKSILANDGNPVPVPFRPDMVCARIVDTSGGTTLWETEEAISEYLSWFRVKEAIIVVSGNTYGGRAEVISIPNSHNIITSRFYSNNVQSEAVYLVPVVMGYYKSCNVDGSVVKAEIETTKGQVYG